MEYNLQRNSTGDLEEVVEELSLAGQERKKHYEKLTDYIKINVPSFVAGILIGFISDILYPPRENASIVFGSMFGVVATSYIVHLTGKVTKVELPHPRTFPMFAGILLGEILVKYLK